MKRPETHKAEAFDIMQYFYRTAHDPLVRCLVRFGGHIDEGALRRAVALSARAVPPLLCRFNAAVRRPRWEACGLTAGDAVRVLEADGEDLEERLLAEMSVDIFRGPQIRIDVVRRPHADSLCVAVSHMVCDGGGFKEYLYLLCGLYGKCRENPAYDEELPLSPRSLHELAARFTLRERLRILGGHDNLDKQKNALRVRLEGQDDLPFIARLTIPAERFAAARLRAKALGATANDMLLAAYARALGRATGETKLTIPCPVDLRKYLPPGRPRICNLTGTLICEVDVGEDEPFGATLEAVARNMAAQKESTACLKGPLLYGLLFPWVSFRWLERHFERLFTIPVTSFTNLGVLDGGRLSFAGAGVEEAYLTAAIKRAPYFQVAASTHEGRCTLTCNLCGTARDREAIGRFLEGMGRELEGEYERT